MSEWFYTKGGQQQGPVDFEALSRLLREGALDPEKDLAWRSGMPDWKPVGSIEGLAASAASSASADVPAADPSNPYAAPSSGWEEPAADPGEALDEIVPGSEPIDVVGCVKRGFELTKRNFGIIILVGITYFAVAIAAGFVFGALDSAAGLAPDSEIIRTGNPDMPAMSFKATSGPIETILSNILSIFLSLGMVRIGLNLVSGKEVSVAMLFGEGGRLLPAIGATILFGLMVGVGLVLLIVPGIYLMLRYGQYMNAIVDRNPGVIDSLKYSSSITTNNRLNLFLLALLAIAIIIAGALALLVGLIFAYPVVWLSWVVAYRWMQYGNRVTLDHPGTTVPLLKS